MKLKLFTFIATCVLLIAARNKNNTTTCRPKNSLLKSITQLGLVRGIEHCPDSNISRDFKYITTFIYDNRNRVIRENWEIAGTCSREEVGHKTYAYSAATVMETDSGMGPLVAAYSHIYLADPFNTNFALNPNFIHCVTYPRICTYALNKNGFVKTDNRGGIWNYNSAGYINRYKWISGSIDDNHNDYIDYTYDTANRLIGIKRQGETGGCYSFNYCKTDSLIYPANPICMPRSSWNEGKITGSMPDSIVETENERNTTYAYKYTTDSLGRLSTQTVTSSDSTKEPVITYYEYY